MGSGSWTTESFKDYSRSRGFDTTDCGVKLCKSMNASQVYTAHSLQEELDPFNVKRECRDTLEHPETIPVILALDVTGSMGSAAVEVSSELNTIMTEIYKDIRDVEFMVMGIGDFAYDDAPLQVSQFESDIRIAEQLDKIYFEFGGGSNPYESYTAAWAFGISQCELDCWKRGKKGIIITMGDEQLNPYIDKERYKCVTNQKDVPLDTEELYREASKKYDIYHINVNHGRMAPDKSLFYQVIGRDHYSTCEIKAIAQEIAQIIRSHVDSSAIKAPEDSAVEIATPTFTENISW